MKATPPRMVVSGLALAVTLTGTWSCGPLPSGGGKSAAPEYYLWAWRRPEDLGFIDPNRVGAAIWTGTTFINDGKMTTQRRTVPVTYPTGTKVVAVMRLEVDRAYGDDMAVRVAAAVVAVGAPFNPIEYQVDFDARRSQRNFYGRLLVELRERAGDARLSITALASWCMFDNWIRALPIDAAVPMVYRLGRGRDSIVTRLVRERTFSEPICAGNVGYSADEPIIWVEGLRRVFLFHPKPWTEDRFSVLIHQLEKSR